MPTYGTVENTIVCMYIGTYFINICMYNRFYSFCLSNLNIFYKKWNMLKNSLQIPYFITYFNILFRFCKKQQKLHIFESENTKNGLKFFVHWKKMK